ncbi:MAG: NusA-like transcription termination signal-binding factor [Methanoculleaceae archaeon]
MDILIAERTIGFKERRYIEELRILTGAVALDCIIDDRFDRVIFIVRQGEMGPAIGRHGDNIRKMRRVLGRNVEMVEYSEDPERLIANLFKPAVVHAIEDVPGRYRIMVRNRADLSRAIGRGGRTVERARLVARRLLAKDIGDVEVADESRA